MNTRPSATLPGQLSALVAEHAIESVDLKYSDLVGNWYHVSFPVRRLEHVITHGVPFDGSSIPGMQSVESGDMLLLPDPATAVVDPFAGRPTLRMLCHICDAGTRLGVDKDPRTVARRAHEHMVSSGIADTSLWMPEFEFYLFNEATFDNGKFSSGYSFTSAENKDALPEAYRDIDGPNPVLKLALEEIGRAAKQRVHVAVSLRRDGDDQAELLASLGGLFCAGARVDFAALHPEGRVVPTPLYPFQREEYWFGGKRGIDGRKSAHPFAGMIGANATELEAAGGGERFWQPDLFREALGSESKRDGEIVLPAAELLATALGIGARLWPGDASVLEAFELAAPITLYEVKVEDGQVLVRVD